jgi:SAM-dependent methyltransferase
LNSKHGHHHHEAAGHHHGHSREGAKQPEVFNPARAALLDDPKRFEFLPPDDIAALLDAPREGVVVDFGAGTGTFSIEIGRRRPDLKVIALDEQPGMLELMKAKPAAHELKNIQPMLTDRIDSIKGAADRVLAINVLHEVGDNDLQEMRELLKPQGSALIIDWDGAMDRPIGPPKDHTHSIAEARDRLAKAGFETETLDHLRYHFVLRARRSGTKEQVPNG